MNEQLLVALAVVFGLYKGVRGDDAYARKWRPRYRREVRVLLARARKAGLGDHIVVRRIDVAFYVSSHRGAIVPEVDAGAPQKRNAVRRAIKDLFGNST